MTVESLTIRGLSDDEQADLDRLWNRLSERRSRNLLRASYYDGKRAARMIGTTLPPQYHSLGIVLGWTSKSVDMLARRCNPEGFFWPDGELDSVGYTDLLESNGLLAEIKAGLVSSLIHGTSFAITTAGDVDAGEPAALVTVKDALNASGLWNPRRRALDAALSVTSWDRERPTGLYLYRDGVIVDATKGPEGWSVSRTEHRYGVPVEPLVYRPRTGKEFGSSRITRPQMSLQDLAVRAVLRMEGHMDVYSIPQLVLLGADEGIFRNADGSQKASWQIALGRVFGIPDDEDAQTPRADVKHFPAQSPTPHLSQLSALAKMFAREASLPDAALAITDMANPTSADAYVAANDDLISEAEGATDDWSVPLRRTVARALAIQNDVPVDDRLRTLGIQWRSPVHVSRAAAADAGAKQVASVPGLAETEVGMELLGMTPDQIRRFQAERQRAASLGRLDALVRIAEQEVPTDGVAG